MRILMLGNSFTFTNDLPQILAELTEAEVVHHTRGGAWLSEQLNPATRLGGRTQAALTEERWNYVVLQEMSHGPITAPKSFFSSVERLCGQIWANGAAPLLFATWAYQKGGAKLAAKNWGYDEMAHALCPQPIKEPLWKTMLCWPMWDSGFMPWPVLGISMLPTASTPVRWAPASRRRPLQP